MAPTQKRKADEAEEVGRDNSEDASKQIGSGSEDEDPFDGLDIEPTRGLVETEHKRQKTAIDAIVKEYLCPLSLELPVEPVTAEDGRVYNRADIAKHIENAKNSNNNNGGNDDGDGNDDEYRNLRSPLTNEKMGPKLVPAVQVQNMIRALVENGTVDDANIDQWKEVDETRSKAMNGDLRAMGDLGHWYYHGTKGLVKNLELAYSWFKKAADLGHTRARAIVGIMLYEGDGVKQNLSEGALYLGMAAAMGEPRGAYFLAVLYNKGGNHAGCFAKDNCKARYWLNKALGNFGDYAKGQKTAEKLKKRIDKEEENNGN